MKKQLIVLLLSLSTSLFSIDYTLGSSYPFVKDQVPIVLEGYFSPMAQASMKDDTPGHLNYSDGALAAFYNFYFGKEHALSFEVGYSQMNLNWKQNPRFNEQHFHTAIFTAAYITTAIENWRYVLMGGAHMQLDHSSTFGVGTLWGRYNYSDNVGFHVGFTGQGNQFKCYFFPILGFDWRLTKNIFANIVFPLDFSLHFFLSPEWDIAASYRSFGGWYRSFMKADNDQAFTVHGNGADIGIYYRSTHFEFALYGGPAFGGWIQIKNQHHPRHSEYYKFNWAPFGGAQAKVLF